MIMDLSDIFDEIKSDIKSRLEEFSQIRVEWNTDIIFKELCFCLLTPQSKARNAWKAIENLAVTEKLYSADFSEITPELNIVRFKNNKTRYLITLRKQFYGGKENDIIRKLESTGSIYEKRKWLVRNIKGIGFKEASHFLRNIGFFKDITILDRHILRNLLNMKVINQIPQTITEKRYYDIEDRMKQFSIKIDIPLEYLDFILWYKETGDVFK